ncbi:MAG TPA: Fur family transcriptional regulator [Anaerolineae bacterium]|nr:Fur family transcriptional regulator [Anaerolineae bacterium]
MSHHTLDFAQQLRQQGYRLTPQRQIIIDTLCHMGGHATINQIYDQVQQQAPAIDRATVYRSIHLFHDLGFVLSAQINGQTVYEIAAAHPHHHLVCEQCHTVIPLADHHFHHLAQHLLEEHGFLAHINHITVPGICADCRNTP